ncbi:hypothetical protein AX17_006758, partial [Amanita inopinata Kibby_2008]
SAIKALPDKTDHPGQLFSVLFRKHADSILSDFPNLRIELTWAPGNEAADALAKSAVSLRGLIHSTLSWSSEHNKQKTSQAWHDLWNSKTRTNLASEALQFPPSTNLSPFHKEFLGPRHIHTRIIQ